MKLEEVPHDMLAVRCLACGDHLAIPPGGTSESRCGWVRDHHTLCPNTTAPCPCRCCTKALTP